MRLAEVASLALVVACAPRPASDTVVIPTLVPPPVRPAPAPSSSSARAGTVEPRARAREGRSPGTAILVEWHGKYYEATVLSTTPDGLTRIHYEGYGPEWDEDVGEDRIRPRPEGDVESADDPGFD